MEQQMMAEEGGHFDLVIACYADLVGPAWCGCCEWELGPCCGEG